MIGMMLGPYRILEKLGEGGMGVVYKARDTRLDRTVAIKILPAELSADPDRRARFEREAKTIAGLSHPHICMLFDVGEGAPSGPEGLAPSAQSLAPVHYLVMEYLDGETLAHRLRSGAMPLEQALDVGAQVADALAKAHRHGIVHRDLKPGNIMLMKAGAGLQVKLLDFGLAKLRVQAVEPGVGLTALPTQEPPTLPGAVMGTVPYMAPEQLEGRDTDARSDIFSFGAVLYEMVTGKRPFAGESQASIISAIMLSQPPPLSSMQPVTPPALDRVVRKCLAKDPEARWQNAADLADELRWLRETSGIADAPGVRRPRRGRLGTGLLAAGLVVAAAGAGVGLTWLLRPAAPTPAVARLSVQVGEAEELNAGGVFEGWLPTPGGSRTAFTWTPDGQALVFVGRRGGVQQLYVRRLDAAEAHPLAGTEGAMMPAVSADGQFVAFAAKGAIKKVPFGGGPAMELARDLSQPPRGLVWGDRGRLYFGKAEGTIWQIPAEGTPSEVPTGGASDAKHGLPWPLPGERALLYSVRAAERAWGEEEIVAFTLATGERRALLKDASDARYLPTGHLLFLRRGTLFAVPFDAERLQVRGAPVAMLETVAQALAGGHASDATGAGQYAVAPTGTLAWLPGPAESVRPSELVTVDRGGNVTLLPAPVRQYGGEVRLSPDGRRLAVKVQTLTEDGVWLYDLGRGTLTPLAQGGEAYAQVWSPDGQRLVTSWLEHGQRSLVSYSADGTAPPRVLAPGRLYPSSFTPDGRQLAAASGPSNSSDIVIVTDEHGKARVAPLLETPYKEWWPAFSPDGRWLAYGSSVSGRDEVYVRPYPGPGPAEQVSIDGGHSPVWHPGGKELLFLGRVPGETGGQFMMAVEFRAGPPVTVGRPRPLFGLKGSALNFSCGPVRCFDISPDGQRFYGIRITTPPPRPVVTHINLIQNWFEELKAKVPTTR